LLIEVFLMSSVRAKRRADGTTYFQALVRLKGHPPQSASFDRKTDAKRWGEQMTCTPLAVPA